jgi:hypothetical protein
MPLTYTTRQDSSTALKRFVDEKSNSFDITNMYTNIPTIELTDIINKILHKNTAEKKKTRANDINKHNHKPQLLTVQQRIL